MENVINCIEDIKDKINSQDYINLYNLLSELNTRTEKPTFKHEAFINLKTTLTIAYDDGEEVEKEINTSFREVFYSSDRITYTFSEDSEIQYTLIRSGVNPFRLVSNKNFYTHQLCCFKKYRSIIIKRIMELHDIGNFDYELEIIRIQPLE